VAASAAQATARKQTTLERLCYDDISLDGVHVVRLKFVNRYLSYEYLPRTAANLALTDIRAQQPDAKGPDWP
jgi:hypothetical protein